MASHRGQPSSVKDTHTRHVISDPPFEPPEPPAYILHQFDHLYQHSPCQGDSLDEGVGLRSGLPSSRASSRQNTGNVKVKAAASSDVIAKMFTRNVDFADEIAAVTDGAASTPSTIRVDGPACPTAPGSKSSKPDDKDLPSRRASVPSSHESRRNLPTASAWMVSGSPSRRWSQTGAMSGRHENESISGILKTVKRGPSSRRVSFADVEYGADIESDNDGPEAKLGEERRPGRSLSVTSCDFAKDTCSEEIKVPLSMLIETYARATHHPSVEGPLGRHISSVVAPDMSTYESERPLSFEAKEKELASESQSEKDKGGFTCGTSSDGLSKQRWLRASGGIPIPKLDAIRRAMAEKGVYTAKGADRKLRERGHPTTGQESLVELSEKVPSLSPLSPRLGSALHQYLQHAMETFSETEMQLAAPSLQDQHHLDHDENRTLSPTSSSATTTLSESSSPSPSPSQYSILSLTSLTAEREEEYVPHHVRAMRRDLTPRNLRARRPPGDEYHGPRRRRLHRPNLFHDEDGRRIMET